VCCKFPFLESVRSLASAYGGIVKHLCAAIAGSNLNGHAGNCIGAGLQAGLLCFQIAQAIVDGGAAIVHLGLIFCMLGGHFAGDLSFNLIQDPLQRCRLYG